MMRLRVKGLCIASTTGTGIVDALDFDIAAGEWFALVGESGSGKSATALAIGDLLPAGLVRSGTSIELDGMDLLTASPRELRRVRGADLAYVFQDYAGAFTPYLRLGDQMSEAIGAHRPTPAADRHDRVVAALDEVGLDGVATAQRYPFQLSGGQLQRAALATAMLLEPKLLIADEPTTALDAVTQASVLELIDRLRRRHGCSVLFITHDLRCVLRHADRVAVMRAGAFVESGTTDEISASPTHGYTRQLFAAIPRIDAPVRRLPVLGGTGVPA